MGSNFRLTRSFFQTADPLPIGNQTGPGMRPLCQLRLVDRATRTHHRATGLCLSFVDLTDTQDGAARNLLSDRDDALVVVDWREQSVGLITLAWLALIKVRTYKLYAMVVHVVFECPDGVTRCSAIIGNGRPRRKAQAWRCADC